MTGLALGIVWIAAAGWVGLALLIGALWASLGNMPLAPVIPLDLSRQRRRQVARRQRGGVA